VRWARHVLEGSHCAKAALPVDAVRVASEASALLAARIPEIGGRGLVGKIAGLGGRTRDIAVVASTAEPAIDMLPVGMTTKLAFVAAWFPIVRDVWLNVKSTACGIRRRSCALWALDAGKREVAAEPALSMDTISPTTQLPCDTLLVPIVRNERFVWEVATTCRAIDAQEVARAAISALGVVAVCLATQLANRASWIPKMAHADWLVLELASPLFRGRIRS